MRVSYPTKIGPNCAGIAILAASALLLAQMQEPPAVHAPAVPLIAHDPYFSVWSMADHLTDTPTRHWTGALQELYGVIRIDERNYRFLGAVPRGKDSVPALKQVSSTITPTRTIALMQSPEIELRAEFLNPLIPEDMELMSRPVTYLSLKVQSRDGKPHKVSLYLDASGTLAANDPGEAVVWSRARIRGLDLLRAGSQSQPVLQRFGDDVRIDWGQFYIAVPQDEHAVSAAGDQSYRNMFFASGSIPDEDDIGGERAPQSHYPPSPALNVFLPMGSVNSEPVTRHPLLVYDDGFSVQYMERDLLPYWRKEFPSFAAMLEAAEEQYPEIEMRSQRFDTAIESDLERAGGPEYAGIATLAFQQAIAAHKLVEDEDGNPFFMPKENFSNGSISTADVIYPSAPMFLFLNPKLVEAQLKPVMRYAEMARWKFQFAPHDLGVYPSQTTSKTEAAKSAKKIKCRSKNRAISFCLWPQLPALRTTRASPAATGLCSLNGPNTSKPTAWTPRTSSVRTILRVTLHTTPIFRSKTSKRLMPMLSSPRSLGMQTLPSNTTRSRGT
jgi:Domain of unknown function (DUF5127)/Domain of unknown function (DUF4965)/Domain of unknown function (DUF4964)